jgi:hypothetical protein
MARDLSNSLQSLIAGAAAALPAATGETDRHRARISGAGSGVVILADVSSSMAEAAGGRRKIDLLRDAIASAWPDLPGTTVIAFGSTAEAVPGPADLPPPSGGTALHLALDVAAKARPVRTLVVSDGRPDSESAAMAAADRLPGVIDVIYCGPDSDADAIAFMYRLARIGGGRVVVRDVAREARPRLDGAVRAALGLPAPKE